MVKIRLPGSFGRVFRPVRRYKLLSLGILLSAIGLLFQLTDRRIASHWLLGLVALTAALWLAWELWDDFRHGKSGLNILPPVAVIAAVFVHEYWAALVVVAVAVLSKGLITAAKRKASQTFVTLTEQAPARAQLLRGAKTVAARAADVTSGDKSVIGPGELVPADAIIIQGSSLFDESRLTGVSEPLPVNVNDTVLAGSLNVGNPVMVKALRPAAASQYAQMTKLLRSAAASPAPFVKQSERYAVLFAVAVLIITGAVWYGSGSARRGLEVLIVATPMPFLLSVPAIVAGTIDRLGREGVFIRTGGALQRLASLASITFAKNGTLTTDLFLVKSVKAYQGFDEDDVLGLAASLEQSSGHNLGTAIVAAADARQLKPARAKHVRELSGLGLEAHIKGKDVVVGRLELLTAKDVDIPAAVLKSTVEETAAWVAVDGRLAGIIRFENNLRPETNPTLKRLRQLGLKDILLLTGDHLTAANKLAGQLKIKDVAAGALPSDKLHLMEQLAERPTAYVTTDAGDVSVLSAADVGVAIGARGAVAASEAADAVIMADDLGAVAQVIHRAQRTFSAAKRTLVFGVILNFLLMAAFATGKFPPLFAAAIQAVFVILTALATRRLGST